MNKMVFWFCAVWLGRSLLFLGTTAMLLLITAKLGWI